MSPPDPALSTPLTRAFGTRLPVVAGGLMWLANADYVAAGARAGILSFITAASFPDAGDLRIPYLLGGGIATGAQLVAALAMGAAGVVIGTRFLVADEIWAHPAYKAAVTAASERDTALTMHTVRNTIRTLRNKTTETVARLEAENPEIGIEGLMPHVSGRIAREGYRTGEIDLGMYSAGQALGLTGGPEPLAVIVDRIEAEALAALTRLRPGAAGIERAAE